MTELEVIVDEIRKLIAERGDGAAPEITPESRLIEELRLDSFEVAELSARLEEQLGSDPVSAGLMPATVAEIASFYD
jgi:acyl carrier protein